mgnify:CR=1 FL=1
MVIVEVAAVVVVTVVVLVVAVEVVDSNGMLVDTHPETAITKIIPVSISLFLIIIDN